MQCLNLIGGCLSRIVPMALDLLIFSEQSRAGEVRGHDLEKASKTMHDGFQVKVSLDQRCQREGLQSEQEVVDDIGALGVEETEVKHFEDEDAEELPIEVVFEVLEMG